MHRARAIAGSGLLGIAHPSRLPQEQEQQPIQKQQPMRGGLRCAQDDRVGVGCAERVGIREGRSRTFGDGVAGCTGRCGEEGVEGMGGAGFVGVLRLRCASLRMTEYGQVDVEMEVMRAPSGSLGCAALRSG